MSNMEPLPSMEPQPNLLTPSEFLATIPSRPGQLSAMLHRSHEAAKLLGGFSPDNLEFQAQVFLALHAPLLNNPGKISAEIFGLYEQSDLDAFLETLPANPESASQNGKIPSLKEVFAKNSRTIRLCHDLNFYAVQPRTEIDPFNKAVKLFHQDYNKEIMESEPVRATLQAYKTVLERIRGKDGNIPEYFIRPDGSGVSQWDRACEAFMRNGSKANTGDPQGLERKMLQTLAKAEGIVTEKLLEFRLKKNLFQRIISAFRKGSQKDFPLKNNPLPQPA